MYHPLVVPGSSDKPEQSGFMGAVRKIRGKIVSAGIPPGLMPVDEIGKLMVEEREEEFRSRDLETRGAGGAAERRGG